METAQSVAGILHALATPSRVRILARLQDGPHSVGELTEAIGMEQSAVSHQLRHLRDLGFVTAERQGRHMLYELFDDHVAELIDQALSHAEHLRTSVPSHGGRRGAAAETGST
ncbi:transcriptional regulator [Pedococcus bigeumensis]|uniref:Transcriptional regulator n=2 Tax=Pedococcus bigeumensis TaxID=433644 RepID=A0A502D045_9MICO|nr:transcriptional regulator [Pedococcus bigeumensis]